MRDSNDEIKKSDIYEFYVNKYFENMMNMLKNIKNC